VGMVSCIYLFCICEDDDNDDIQWHQNKNPKVTKSDTKTDEQHKFVKHSYST